MWMTQADFIDFCGKSDIIDYYSLNEDEINSKTQEYDLLYIHLTSQRSTSVKIQKRMFY